MSDDEIAAFLEQSRTATMATIGPNGLPHLVAMWYGLIDGKLYFETKAKAQKVVNLRRDPGSSCSVEAGLSYDQLRGVSIEGTATIIEAPTTTSTGPPASACSSATRARTRTRRDPSSR